MNTHAPWITDKWRPGTGCVAVLGYARHCEVRGCRLRGMSGIAHPGTGFKCRTIDNRFTPICGPFGTTGMGWMIGVDCIVEGNVCEDSNRGFTCGPWFGPIERNFIARNGVIHGGSVEGAGESFLFEGPDVGLENWFGRPVAAGPDWLQQNDQRWKPDAVKGRVALVVHGRGFGQWRRVERNTEDRMLLDRPWSVVPDRDSLVVVRQFFMQNVLVNNYGGGVRCRPRHRPAPGCPGCSLLKDWCQDAKTRRTGEGDSPIFADHRVGTVERKIGTVPNSRPW